MKLAWLTDVHLNFLGSNERKKFYQEIINTRCDGVLISGDIAEAPSIKDILLGLSDLLKNQFISFLVITTTTAVR
jgi:hypothetical protein